MHSRPQKRTAEQLTCRKSWKSCLPAKTKARARMSPPFPQPSCVLHSRFEAVELAPPVQPLINCERSDFVALNGEVVIERDRTSIKRSRYLHRNDDDVYLVLFDPKSFDLNFDFRDCLRIPTFNAFFSLQL